MEDNIFVVVIIAVFAILGGHSEAKVGKTLLFGGSDVVEDFLFFLVGGLNFGGVDFCEFIAGA